MAHSTTPSLGMQDYFTTTLSSQVNVGDTVINLNAVPTASEGFLVIDPNNVSTREVIYYNSKTSSTVVCPDATQGSSRGLGGTTVQSHAAGVAVEMRMVAEYWNAIQSGQSWAVGSIGATAFASGWAPGLATPNTVTYNGNRNYSLVFNGTDLTPTISNGMRLKLTRTVTAPTQCTSLNGTTQYYSKATPNGMTFTDDFTVSAWIKVSSYASSMIASRYNGTSGWAFFLSASGQVTLQGNNAGAANSSYIQAYQSVPLNKWVHVQANLDMSAFTTNTDGGASGSTMAIDGVNVPASVTRGGTNPTALVQAGNLEIGSWNGGLLPFPGKIAQVAIFSSKITIATMQGYISQGLAGTETSLISAYSFNNSINDLNANANNLTANGSAVATNVDSPFAGGANASTAYTAGTTEFGEVFNISFSTNTTVVVQVPDGYAIPTTGGVSAVSYSTQAVPLGWPLNGGITQLGYIALLTGTMGTTNTPTSWLGFTMPVYVPNGRKVKLRVYGNITSSVTSSGMEIGICRTSVSAANALASNLTRCITSTVPQGVYAEGSDNTSGSVTYLGYWKSVDAATLSGVLNESGNLYIAWMSIELV